MAFDALIVALVLAMMARIRPLLSILPFAEPVVEPLVLPLPLYILFPMTWVALMTFATVYDGRHNLHIIDELTSLSFGSLLSAISLAGISYFSFRDISRVMFLFFAALTYGLMLIWRIGARFLFRYGMMNGASQHRCLIIGAGETGQDIRRRVNNDESLNMNVVGFLDDQPSLLADGKNQILGNLSAVCEMIEQHAIDNVIIALPEQNQDDINALIGRIDGLPVRLWVVPSYYALALYKIDIEEFAGVIMFDLRAPALSDYQRLVKRIFDLVLVLISLPFILPFMILIAAAIYLDDPGTVLFRQKRLGENGKMVTIIKFRTMVIDADKRLCELLQKDSLIREEYEKYHKLAKDPRVTRVGRWLRKYSLDELPQIWNVLMGEMSLVGPRAYMPSERNDIGSYSDTILRIRPGLTGWWQVMGRHLTLFKERLVLDTYYISHWSIWLDLYILMKTVLVVLKGRGA
ncbi:MAG: sugar transferase [Chloroflexota bacterium]